MKKVRTLIAVALAGVLGAVELWAMQPPTEEQIERYRADDTLTERAEAASRFGNHRVAPELAARVLEVDEEKGSETSAGAKRLPSVGRQKVFALLIGFSDYPGRNPVGEINRRLFAAGPSSEFPYESLRDYYRRSSFGLLELEGATLGWYTTPYPRSGVRQTDEGREALIREVIDHFDGQGHDFSQYDNDGDGQIDYFLVFYAGPRQEWGDFWWGYQTDFGDSNQLVDGLRLGAYSWQWESPNGDGPFAAGVAIHETGHALGLPDYYDYDDEIGPRGGLGGLDMMDSGWGDHNAFSKYLLGWIEPVVINEGSQRLRLRPSSSSGEAAIVMHGDPVDSPYDEYFLVQYRWRSGNDVGYPADGALIWHIDASTDVDGRFLFDNSYTDHKLIRLMEADGHEEIEQNFGADAGDFYRSGDVLSPTSVPNSRRYDGTPTNLLINDIVRSPGTLEFGVDLGSGCGIFAEVAGLVTGWSGISTAFRAAVDFSNCNGTAPLDWDFGDGAVGSGSSVGHVYPREGSFSWKLSSDLGDASLRCEGEILICSDPRCYQWRPAGEMRGPRLQHASVVLADGRVLVVGGGVPPEIFDPGWGSWISIPSPGGSFEYASAQRLTDGRVLVTGSSAGNPTNAEIYDPVTNTWRVTDRMEFDRVMHSSIRLADGRVLVAGGYFDETTPTISELWDPATERWASAGGIGLEEVPGLALLPDGEVLFVGRNVSRIFNPLTNSWRRTADLRHDHRYAATVGLEDGRVLVMGGEGLAETEIFDPVAELWWPGPPMNGIRAVPSATVLPSGEVVVTGGADRFWRIGSRVEIFDPVSGVWTEIQPMAESRLAHSIVVLTDGSVLATGGTVSVLEEPYEGQTTAERFLMPVQTTAARSATGRVSP